MKIGSIRTPAEVVRLLRARGRLTTQELVEMGVSVHRSPTVKRHYYAGGARYKVQQYTRVPLTRDLWVPDGQWVEEVPDAVLAG